MAEQQVNGVATEQGLQFAIQRIFVKDISFEAPNAPAIFRKNGNQKCNWIWTPVAKAGRQRVSGSTVTDSNHQSRR